MSFAYVLVRQVKHNICPELLDCMVNLIHRCLHLEFLQTLRAWVYLVFIFIVLFEIIKIAPPW